MTEYFFWPKTDAWEELKAVLEKTEWMKESDRISLLNTCTEVINFWQDEKKHSIEEAREQYPQCTFQGRGS